jgi:distribution and morphology protein 12
MSIDLDWLQLSPLSHRLVESLNRHLQSTERPSFLGPITINSFEFGTSAPDVELIDVRDIYRDFLEDEDDESTSETSQSSGSGENGYMASRPQLDSRRSTGKSTGSNNMKRQDDEDGFEWVNRRGAGRGLAEAGPGYHSSFPHVRYGGGPPVSYPSGSTSPITYRSTWDTPEVKDPAVPSASSSRPTRSTTGPVQDETSPPFIKTKNIPSSEDVLSTDSLAPSPNVVSTEPQTNIRVPTLDESNDLQFHARVIWNSDLRISLTTSLLLNYPAPLFMALPVRLSIVGIEFNGEVVVAYQSSQKRLHVCILDDLDPYRPASASTRPEPTDPDLDPNQYEKPKTSVGERLLPHIFIESEIGQTDKQVLRNVYRVERFIQDLIRTTLEDELVFPNFHTIVYGD